MPSYVPPQPESGGHSPHLAHHQHPNGPSPRGPNSSLTSSLSCPHMLYGHQKHHSQAGPTGVANGLSAASRSSSSLLTSPTRPPAGSTLRSQSQTQYSGNSSSGLSSPVSRSRSGSRGRVKEGGNSQLWRSQTSATGGVAPPLMSPTKPDSYGEERSSSSRSYRTVSPSTTERGPSRSASNTLGVTPQPPSYLQSTVLAPSGPGPQRERERRERDKSETRSHYTRPPTHDRTGSKTTPRQTEDRPGRSTRRPSLSGSSGGGQGGGSRSASNGSAPPRSRSATPVTRGGGHSTSTSQSPHPTNPTEARGEGEKAAAVRCELSDQWMSGIEEITQQHEEQLRVERETWKNYAATMITALQAQYQQAASNSFASESAKSDEMSRKLRKRVEEVEAALSTERRRHERLKGTSRDLETALEQEKGSNSRLRERQAQLEGRLKALEEQLHEASMKPKIERAPPLEEDPQPSNFSTSTTVQPTSPGNVPRHHSHKIEGMRPDSTEPRQEEGQDATNTQAPGATLGQPWTPRAFQYMLNTNGEGEASAADTSEPSPSSSHRPPLPLPSRSQTYYSANTAASSSSPQTCPQAAVWSVGKGWQTLDQAPPRTAEYQTIDLSVNPISASRSRSPATADDSSRSERRERELNRSISATGGWGYGSSTTTIDLTSGASGASTDRSHVRTHSAPRSRSRERAETARESQPLTNLLHKFKSGMKRALSQERISGSSNGSRGRSRSSIGIEDTTSSQPQLHSSNHFSPRRAPGGEAAVFNAVNPSSAFTATTHASPDQYSASPGHHF